MTTTTTTTLIRERVEPRISLNKLGEYLLATPARRRRIIEEQKRPPTFQVIWYEASYQAIRSFLASEERDEERLQREVERLASSSSVNEQEALRLRSNAEAIESFLHMWRDGDVPTRGIELAPGDELPAKLALQGVEVSIRPDLLSITTLRGNRGVGVIKLYFSKHHPLNLASGSYIAAVLETYARMHLSEHGDIERRGIMVLDVLGRVAFSPPRAQKRRMADVAAACEEIRLRWPDL